MIVLALMFPMNTFEAWCRTLFAESINYIYIYIYINLTTSMNIISEFELLNSICKSFIEN